MSLKIGASQDLGQIHALEGEMMVKTSSKQPNEFGEMTGAQKERAVEADVIYRKVCDDLGMRVCSWQSFAAWREYLDEKISETDLKERARDELEQFSKTFGKYLVVEKDDRKLEERETEKKERAKRANKIYKKVCDDTGLTACFFRDFSTWSEYVKGNMAESEFYAKAKSEMEKVLAQQPLSNK